MTEHWSEQYEDTAKRLELLGINDAADDIRTLVDGLKKHEEEQIKLSTEPRYSTPRYSTLDEIKKSNLPAYVEFPKDYFSEKVGPRGFDPQLMYLHALAMTSSTIGGVLPYETKPWVILWLLDHVDWAKLNLPPQHCSKCGRELHGFKSGGFPTIHLCRYCDTHADKE